ncbi:Hypothetical predicted protein [Pelobates cultripes]|uniref:Uncharacterized protein n=1 Tax=Pelobates cultripes TaxID=61616 RepID=A0AAD1WR98_PELCU|nr:Hypothetical predicted protein [Pelobates cultripes]
MAAKAALRMLLKESICILQRLRHHFQQFWQRLQDKYLLPVTQPPKSDPSAQIPRNPCDRHVALGPVAARIKRQGPHCRRQRLAVHNHLLKRGTHKVGRRAPS